MALGVGRIEFKSFLISDLHLGSYRCIAPALHSLLAVVRAADGSRSSGRETISRFERAMVDAARRRHVDGVICGHSPMPADRRHDGFRDLNCGDWMSNCTAIGETEEGEFRLLAWPDVPDAAPATWRGPRSEPRHIGPAHLVAQVWR